MRSAGCDATIWCRSCRSGSIGQLNWLLVDACESDLGRRIAGRPVTVAEQLAAERPGPARVARRFDCTETTTVRVDSKALVTPSDQHQRESDRDQRASDRPQAPPKPKPKRWLVLGSVSLRFLALAAACLLCLSAGSGLDLNELATAKPGSTSSQGPRQLATNRGEVCLAGSGVQEV